ncbi:glycosyltransferase family 39 protein [Engelhardtia mirabilis]|uniref:PA14 domain-containing protein n=1 Tax=Engelhardtia mirabilis TaxID=2528011 RepID=A0A518BGG5_9BACT|nr:hypothetical protein Pla133_11160 [Planctomycetes bacterium Pla133]QDV00377.1 hypothetical protein Pla86_11160 [Planctomycetes bacterium Pla86]
MRSPSHPVHPAAAACVYAWALVESLHGWPYAVGLVLPLLLVGLLVGDRARLVEVIAARRVALALGALALALTAARLGALEHGLAATYRTDQSPEAGERSVAYRQLEGQTRVDELLSFDEESRGAFVRRWPLSFLNHRRFAIAWDRRWPTVHLDYPDAVERFRPSPRVRPEFEVVWRGVFTAPETGHFLLRAEGGMRSRFEFEGQQAAKGRDATQAVDLVAGQSYDLSIRNTQGAAQPTRFELLWGSAEEGLEPVPRRSLSPRPTIPGRRTLDALASWLALALVPARALVLVGALACLLVSRRAAAPVRGFLGVTAIALALRLAVHAVYFGQPHSGIMQGFGNDDYLHFSHALRIVLEDPMAPGHAYYWAPLYRYFLALTMLVVGEDFRHVVLVQNVLGALTCGLAFRIGQRVFSPRAGWAAGLVCAFYPFLAYYEWTTFIAALATFLATLAIDRAVAARALPSARNLALAGVAAALAILARPNLGLFLLAVAAWFALRGGEWSTRLRRTAIFLVAASLTVLPVTVRNFAVSGEFVPITSNGAVNVYIGNNPDADGTYQNPPEDVDPSQFTAIAREFILEHTGDWLALERTKLELLLAERQLWPLLLLALCGWISARARGNRRTLPVSAMAAGVLVVPILFFMHDRFLVPGVPALAVLAGHAIDVALGRLGWGRPAGAAARRALAAGLVVAAVLYVTFTAYGTTLRNRVQAPWNLGAAAPVTPWFTGDLR